METDNKDLEQNDNKTQEPLDTSFDSSAEVEYPSVTEEILSLVW